MRSYAALLYVAAASAVGAPNSNFNFEPTPNDDEVKGRNSNAFNPAIGHPTAEERRAFVDEVSALAKKVVKGKSIPASVVAAQCIGESGFGFTRTAVFANNFLGMKDFNADHHRFQLVGQRQDGNDFSPIIKNLGRDRIIYDEKRRRGNHYRIFASREACVRYLTEELFERPKYAEVLKKYGERRKAGQDLRTIADIYVKELGDIYYRDESNPGPGGEAYARQIIPVMRKWDLYRLDEVSGTASSASNAAAAPAIAERTATTVGPDGRQLAALKGISSVGRYMEDGRSSGWSGELPGWESVHQQLRLHTYSPGTSKGDIPKSLKVLLWDPNPELAAHWVADAVTQALGRYDHDVARYYAAAIVFQSGFQFPVRGFVYESGKVYTFWDGVTVSLRRQAKPEEFALSAEDLAVLGGPNAEASPLFRAAFAADAAEVKRTGKQGRVVSVTKGGASIPSADADFRKFVREGHIAAMQSDHSKLAQNKFRNAYGTARDVAFKRLQNEIRGMISEDNHPATDAQVEAQVARFERGR